MKHSIFFSCVGLKQARLLFGVLAMVAGGSVQASLLPEIFAYQYALTNCPDPYRDFCETVAIDGDTIAFGGRDYEAVHVYVRQGMPWAYADWRLEDVLTYSGGQVSSDFGEAVALSGSVAAVSACAEDGSRGAVFLYERTNGNWALQARVVASDRQAFDRLGDSVALSGDTLVAGAPGSGTSVYPEAAYVFVRQETNWVQQQKLTAFDGAWGDHFGCAVAIDGDTIVVGADHRGTATNAVYVFVRQGTTWTNQQKLTAGEYVASDTFGMAVTVKGDSIAVSAPYNGSGAIYMFRRTNNVWSLKQKLTAANELELGRVVSLGDELLAATSQTNIYVFAWDGLAWTQRSRPSDSGPRGFGPYAMALGGDTIVAGWITSGAPSGPVLTYAPNYADDTGLAAAVRGRLYFPNAQGPGKNTAAFRYKHLLYGQDGNGLRAQVEAMTNFYGATERALAADAEADVWRGLSLNTNSVALGHLLLDIYYDRVVAESLLVRDELARADTARFGPPLAPPAPPGGFLIANEIPRHRQALATSRSLWQVYFGLFTTAVAVQTPSGPGAPDGTFGARIFRELVPGRGLDAATYLSNGVPVSVVTNSTLFTGYKDLVLVFDMLRDHGRLTETLSRLLCGRNGPGDREEAAQLIGEARRFLYLQGSVLQNLFTNLPPAGDPSGLAEAMAGWSASLNRMEAMEAVFVGSENPLGFAPDFLMLVEKFQGPATTVFNSFDSLMERLSLDRADSPLRRARDRLGEARAAYEQYRGYQDQLADRMSETANGIQDRLFEIVGARPGDLNYYDNPTNNPGSELDQQYRSADAARLKIEENWVAMNNLSQQVQIELDLIAATNAVTVRYGTMKAPVQRVVDRLKGIQSVFSDISEWGTITLGKDPNVSVNPGKFAVSIFKWASLLNPYNRPQELAQLAADEQAEISGLQTTARTKTILLGLRTLRVEGQAAALTLQQEVNRLAALYREKADLEARLAENGEGLAARYFADPVHLLAVEATQMRANLAFAEAQKWLFFAARAFEYKWNIAFTNWVYSDHTWSLSSLFALRNADELEDFCDALGAYDATINRAPDDAYDWFSVREDFMGLKLLDDQGQPAFYRDPVSGQALDALSLFRTNLLRSLQPVLAGQQIVLQFDTVRQIPGGTFFVGPTFDLQGNLVSPGRFLDKIGWVKIQLLGPTNRTQLAGTLTYGGNGFIRNWNPGHLAAGRPDQLLDEMTRYSTRYWCYNPVQQRWTSAEGMMLSGVPMAVMPDPDLPPSVNQIEELKERSVAATGWVLRIPVVDQGVPVLSIGELNDVRLYIYHYSVSRH